ncbi:hypothetical protein B0H19DRAFT_1369039 [Mycena capillaripes]|nr:hypothetical protein B0H19DRAFT_1369039 [Mycena capillaripes]
MHLPNPCGRGRRVLYELRSSLCSSLRSIRALRALPPSPPTVDPKLDGAAWGIPLPQPFFMHVTEPLPQSPGPASLVSRPVRAHRHRLSRPLSTRAASTPRLRLVPPEFHRHSPFVPRLRTRPDRRRRACLHACGGALCQFPRHGFDSHDDHDAAALQSAAHFYPVPLPVPPAGRSFSSGHSTPFRQAKMKAKHNHGRPRSAQQIHIIEPSLTSFPFRPSRTQLKHSADSLSRGESCKSKSFTEPSRSRYTIPRTTNKHQWHTPHATESVEAYEVRYVSLVCVFHFVPGAFYLGSVVFIYLLAGCPYSLLSWSCERRTPYAFVPAAQTNVSLFLTLTRVTRALSICVSRVAAASAASGAACLSHPRHPSGGILRIQSSTVIRYSAP